MRKLIIVAGGMGPNASNYMSDLVLKSQGSLTRDQDYLSMIHVSVPEIILDRNAFLKNNVSENSGMIFSGIVNNIFSAVHDVYEKAFVIAPCNIFHNSEIRSSFVSNLHVNIQPIHIVNETAHFIAQGKIADIGLISTNQTYNTRLYHDRISVSVSTLSCSAVEEMHNIIY